MDPRLEARPGLEALQLPVGLQERVLDDVLGVRLASGQAEGELEDTAPVSLDEPAERRFVPGLRLGDIVGVVRVHLVL